MLSSCSIMFFFFNDTATTEIYTLSLHDALPILRVLGLEVQELRDDEVGDVVVDRPADEDDALAEQPGVDVERALTARVLLDRSEEHTSELQSRQYLVCRLLLEKKKNKTLNHYCS